MKHVPSPVYAVSEWDGHPNTPVSDSELRRLIAEDWERTLGR